MSLGSWEVNVSVGSMPEKVATAVAKLNDDMVGAEYTPIAYLGSQLVNGTNHAVLAEQLIVAGKDTKNVVLLIFNEHGMECTLVNIERVLESGTGMGAVSVDVKTDIPVEAKLVFEKAVGRLMGVNTEAFALLGTQIVNGIDYIYAAESELVTVEPVKKVLLVTVNSLTNQVSFVDILK